MIDVIKRALKFTILSEVWAILRIKSWIKLEIPRFAMMKRRVTGPGMPSVYPSPLATSSGDAVASSEASVPPEPATNWNVYTFKAFL